MKVCKPDYYEDFTCIANKCEFTCCQDWAIAVDDSTMNKWRSLKIPEKLKCQKKYLSDHTALSMGTHIIKLNENGICPYLNSEGLCHLVLQYGEDTLSRTCHEFPRERHEYSNRVEYTLSLGCRSVLDYLWGKNEFTVRVSDEPDEHVKQFASETPEVYFKIRDWFIEIASDKLVSIPDVLRILFYLILELDEMEEKKKLSDETFLDYRNSNIVTLLIEKLKNIEDSLLDTFYEDNELLLDIAENYRKKKIYSNYLEPIATHAAQYEQIIKQKHTLVEGKIGQFSIIWKKHEENLRKLICEELYSSLLLPNSALYCMIMKMEWLTLEYVTIRQWMFLYWDQAGSLKEKDLKEAVSVIFRMTGYSDDDIEEYLENSFEEVIWDWGYLSFIL